MAVFLLPLTLALVCYLLCYYSSKQTPFYVSLLVFITMLLTFGIVTLLPYDVYLVGCIQTVADNDESAMDRLHTAWVAVYWTLFALCWVVLPLLVNYEFAGEFTPCTRFRRAVLKRLKTILFTVILLILFLVYMSYKKKVSRCLLHRTNLASVLVALSNIWGLLMVIVFLSYGVVEVPKLLWRRASLARNLRFKEFQTALIHDRMFEASAKLENSVRLIHAAHKTVPNSSSLRVYVDVLISKCPPKMLETQSALKTHEDPSTLSALGAVKLSKLVALHHDLKYALAAVRTFQCEWERHLDKTFYLQDVQTAQEAGSWLIDSELRRRSKCCCARIFYSLEYCWKAHFVQWGYLLASIVTAIASVLLVLGEVTLFVETPVTGIPLLFHSSYGFVGTQIVCLLPLMYVLLCTEIGLFNIKFSVAKSLFRRHSEPASMVWTAAFLARLITPLCYNFLLLIKVDSTQYSDVMGVLNLVPALGPEFTHYFPVLIIPFCVGNYFRVFGRLLSMIRLQEFTFADRYDESKGLEGVSLLIEGSIYAERKARGKNNPICQFSPSTDRFTDVFTDAKDGGDRAAQSIADAVASSSAVQLQEKYRHQ